LKATRPGSIVLSHDIHPGTIEAMPAIFTQLEQRGFKFVTVSELIAMATPEPPKALPVAAAKLPKQSHPSASAAASPPQNRAP
jgi:hypothetical protein